MHSRTTTNPTALFIGDSITDAGRRSDPSGFYGAGYVRRLHEMLSEDRQSVNVINRGIGGDRVRDLRRRWSEDCIALQPQVLTVLVGINDTGRRYAFNDPTSTEEFREDYSAILGEARDAGIDRIVVLEPFLVPVNDQQAAWGPEDLDAKRDAARAVAVAVDALFVPLHEPLNALGRAEGLYAAVEDGVHPAAPGHQLIADLWLEQASPLLDRA